MEGTLFRSLFVLYDRGTVIAVVHRCAKRIGLCPSDCICQDGLHIGVIEGAAAFMTGLEVKYLAATAIERAACTEYMPVLIPAQKDQIIGGGNGKGLTVHLLALKLKMLGDPCGDRVRGKNVPHKLFLLISPKELTACADDRAKRL